MLSGQRYRLRQRSSPWISKANPKPPLCSCQRSLLRRRCIMFSNDTTHYNDRTHAMKAVLLTSLLVFGLAGCAAPPVTTSPTDRQELKVDPEVSYSTDVIELFK